MFYKLVVCLNGKGAVLSTKLLNIKPG